MWSSIYVLTLAGSYMFLIFLCPLPTTNLFFSLSFLVAADSWKKPSIHKRCVYISSPGDQKITFSDCFVHTWVIIKEKRYQSIILRSSNLGPLKKPSIQVGSLSEMFFLNDGAQSKDVSDWHWLWVTTMQALIHGSNRHYYSIAINYRKNKLDEKIKC